MPSFFVSPPNCVLLQLDLWYLLIQTPKRVTRLVLSNRGIVEYFVFLCNLLLWAASNELLVLRLNSIFNTERKTSYCSTPNLIKILLCVFRSVALELSKDDDDDSSL